MKKISKPQIAIQDQNAVVISKIKSFCKRLSVSALLSRSGISKRDGIPVIVIFISILSLVFTGKSFARAYRDKTEGFSDDTMDRFLSNPKHNWRRFLLSIAQVVIRDFLVPLTDEKRVHCLIADDSIYARNRSKKVELLAWVYDHSIGKMMRGFRMLTLAWTDGYSTLGLDFSLLSSGSKEKRLTEITKKVDRRSCGYIRRMESMKEAPEILVEMVRRVLNWGIKARYLLMDSWFCNPALISQIFQLGMNVIGMVKKTSKIHYRFEGQSLDVVKIYRSLRKKRGKAKILTSTTVQLKDSQIPVKLVFVRNRNKKKDWLVLICTDCDLSDEEIVRIYGYRWEIEVLFKMCKQLLRLSKEIQSRDYDALVAHTSIVMIRHNFLSMERREDSDQRTFGILFRYCMDEAKDLTFFEAMKRILSFLIEKLQKCTGFSSIIIDAIIEEFFKTIDFLYPQLFGQGCET